MGRHANAESRRRVAAWPIVVAVAVLLVAGLTTAYFVIIDPGKKTAACTGSTVLPVTASPGAAKAVTDAAAAFNATAPVARSTCVSVSVTTTDGAEAAAALASGWTGQSTPAPGLWVVDTTSDVKLVDASRSAMTAGHTNTPLGTSPVVLAVRAAPSTAVSWSSLADGTSSLVLAVPDPKANRASVDALESLVAASNGRTTAIDDAAVTGASSTLQRLAGASTGAPDTTAAALAGLAAGTGGYTAVPVLESQLGSYNATSSTPLTAVYPTGPTAGDEIIPIPLTATWVTNAMSDAAAAFDGFLSDAKGLAVLAADHLRTSAASTTVPGVDLTTKVIALPDAPAQTRTALQSAWAAASGSTSPSADPSPSSATLPVSSAPATAPTVTTTPTPAQTSTPTKTPNTTAPATTRTTPTKTAPTTKPTPTVKTTPAAAGPAVTLVLDTSGSMDTVQGNQQRITWMQSAVNAVIGASPSDQFGLWSFSTDDGSSGYTKRVPLGPLTDSIAGGTRAAAITSAVNALTPGGDSWTYGAIKAAYADAVDSAVAGRPNRVVVVTDGQDTTPGLSRAALIADVSALAAQNKNVVLDIVGLSADVSADAMSQVAAAGGGKYTQLTDLSTLKSTLSGLTAP
ncbi:von Willebrand factor type A domain-containing protein [Nakamurella panacisegetis]|uniref:von Willebrand factor type A domain-containing protein n=1 Tax=Nakamurella panacisegetis TaxID=1090615 RepID=A0A1H0Q3B7_9ACTN|nr:VWA domain-containing protein [Nakamurella panacisegetis]SDP11892.1 von Willebrand factor type A domain-containing protein [Nakamurella panacisegetis]